MPDKIRIMQNFDDNKSNGNQCTEYFNRVIGFVEDIVVSEEFQSLQRNFLEKHYQEFDDNEENKIIYTDIFKEYTSLMEFYIINHLNFRMNGSFQMEKFAQELQNMKPGLDGEIFELLFSLTDFLTFKDLILDYKASKNGRFEGLANGIIVTRIDKQPLCGE
ncbi:ADP-ribosylation factor-like protein 2-binding protein [Pseudolycoriella hygida]|uniref:ADP-ribosylation factor-like protein 2-binding protein n=1 Tax=Pseudolycoriella hygida TaxID=35572 RepID=A0A9Q0MWQ4_9DIPT|nr:ADP-ribosylation factor-like protein 2-binding protein [Pseudolycoriella hygida]